MVKLFLDDVRQPYDDSWYVVRNFGDFQKYIDDYKKQIECPEEPLIVSLDHDLADDHYKGANVDFPRYSEYTEKTGYDCAKYLVESGVIPVQVIVHSWNYYGSKNIENLLKPHTSVIVAPYDVLKPR